MNIAFSAIVLLLALLPGVVFRYAYLKSNSIRRSINTGVASEVALILLVALLLHWVCIPLFEFLFDKTFRFDQFYALIAPAGANVLDLELVSASVRPFIGYSMLTSLIAFGLAKGARYLVLRFNLNKAFKILRVNNEWDRYFTGYNLSEADRKKIDKVAISVVVVVGGERLLYKGYLESYSLNDPHGVDQVTLSRVYRRRLQDDEPREGESGVSPAADRRYYRIPGDYFMIPFAKIENFNITYLAVEKLGEAAGAVDVGEEQSTLKPAPKETTPKLPEQP